jgi:hypothetical protein
MVPDMGPRRCGHASRCQESSTEWDHAQLNMHVSAAGSGLLGHASIDRQICLLRVQQAIGALHAACRPQGRV